MPNGRLVSSHRWRAIEEAGGQRGNEAIGAFAVEPAVVESLATSRRLVILRHRVLKSTANDNAFVDERQFLLTGALCVSAVRRAAMSERAVREK